MNISRTKAKQTKNRRDAGDVGKEEDKGKGEAA